MGNQMRNSMRKNLLAVAAMTVLAGLLFYIVTSFSGYLANSAVNPAPIVCSVVALALIAAVFAAGGRLPALIRDLLLMAAGVLVIISLSLFAMRSVSLAADVYFIPVNYPQAEETALNLSIAGIVLYLASLVTLIAEAFSSKE